MNATPAIHYATEVIPCDVCGEPRTILIRGDNRTLVPCTCGGVKPEVNPYARPGHQPGAEEKILKRLDAFTAKGWTFTDLWELGERGYPGLAFILRPKLGIGRIFTWMVELIHPSIAGRYSSWTTYTRSAPEAQLLATIGPHIRPAQLIVKRYY